ncbi:acyl carrier protein [Bacillus cytotoxicus]
MSLDVIEVLRNIIETESKKEISSLKEDMTFTNLGIESMDKIRIVIQVERKFGVEFSETDATNIETIGDLVHFIKTNGSEVK